MHFYSILLLVFLFLISINSSICLWKTSKKTLETYVIDLLFANSLTIIRCNPFERQIIRDITIEKLGYIKCSNKDVFLPENHIEHITLLQWDSTAIKCDKKNQNIQEEITYLNIKHKPKNAFKKIPLELTRVRSTGPSELDENKKKAQFFFKHPPRKPSIITDEQRYENSSTEIYTFKNRPILCRERRLSSEDICSNKNQNFTYVCYYRIGISEPPTIADMDKELRTLPMEIKPDEDATVDLYINKKPEPKSLWKKSSGIIIIIIILVILGILGFIIYCCQVKTHEENLNITHVDSDTSIGSNVS